jgi:MFS family permease
LLDRFATGPLPAISMCIFPVLASLIILVLPGASLAVCAGVALLVGMAAGVEVDVVPYLVRRYFPERFFGRTYIALAAVFVAGAGAAPFLVSLIYDAARSYALFLEASLVTGLLASGLLVALGRYPVRAP